MALGVASSPRGGRGRLPRRARVATLVAARQSRARAAGGVRRRRSSRSRDCPAPRARGSVRRQARRVHRTFHVRAPCIGPLARRSTRCAHFVRCTQTLATSQSTKRAARAAESPALPGASHARRQPPGRGFAEPVVASDASKLSVATVLSLSPPTTGGGLRGGRHPVAAIGGATSSAGPRAARAQRVLRRLTRRACLSGVSAANAASCATRPRPAQQRAVGAQRRPLPHEPPPSAARRDAPMSWQARP